MIRSSLLRVRGLMEIKSSVGNQVKVNKMS